MKQAKAAAGGLEVRAHLNPVNRCQRIDGFELDNEAIGHQEIEAAFSDSASLVLHSDWNLAPVWEISQSELNGERVLVHRLQKARPKDPVDLDSGADHLRGTTIKPRIGFPHHPGVPGVLALHPPVFGRAGAKLPAK